MRRFLVSVARPALQSRSAPTFTSSLRPFATSGTTKGGKTNAPSTEDGDASRRTGDYGPGDGPKVPLEQEGQGGKGGPTGGNVGQRSTADKSKSTSESSKPSTGQPKRSFATSAKSNSSSTSNDGKSATTKSSTDPSTAKQSSTPGKQSGQADAANKVKSGQDPTHSSPTPTPHEAQNRKASGKSATHGSSATEQHRKQEEYTQHRDLATGAESSVAADRAAHDPLPDKLKHSTKVNNENKK